MRRTLGRRVRSIAPQQRPSAARSIALFAVSHVVVAVLSMAYMVANGAVGLAAGVGTVVVLIVVLLAAVVGLWAYAFRWYDRHGPGRSGGAELAGVLGSAVGICGMVVAWIVSPVGLALWASGLVLVGAGTAWLNVRYARARYTTD